MLCCSMSPCVVLYMIMPACSPCACVYVSGGRLFIYFLSCTSRVFSLGVGSANRAARLCAMYGGPWCWNHCVYAGVYHVTVTSSSHTVPPRSQTVSPSRTLPELLSYRTRGGSSQHM